MFGFQSHFIFPIHAVGPAPKLPKGAERLSVELADGTRLAGVHLPASADGGGKTLILGFGGNAWNGEDVAKYLHELFADCDVVAFHYRGYAPSEGSPSSKALIADAPLIYDAAVDRVKPQRIIAIGMSIGSGIAAELAARRKLDGLILVTPFDSLKAVAQSMYPWIPLGPIFEHEIDEAGALKKVKTPVAIIAAEHDEIVPTTRTNALRAKVPNLVFDRTIARSGHNDIYARSDFHSAMHEALNCLKA
jgi:pimeloyl-ACP methyl ester carboxylesterase